MSDEQDAGKRPERVTERFDEGRATERFGDFRPTDRFVPDTPAARAATLAVGDIVNDRYQVEEMVAAASGEAEIYRCVDVMMRDAVALKLYRVNVAPKQSVLERLYRLRHPNIVALRDYGAWGNRFYEVSDYCEGGSLADHMPYGERELRRFLPEILDGLQYLHDQGIVHRDVKPNNILFRDVEHTDIVLGDFGVSSFLEDDEKVRRTSTGAFFTLDYAAPELIDGQEVSPKTDFYALGITLLHLFTGASPFAGMDKNTILGCHFRGKVPRAAELSVPLRQLVNGLLRVRPESRWGHAQLSNWLEGEPVLTDDGLADRDEIEVGKRIPYRTLPEITTPMEMARRLDEINVPRDLQRGYISQWLMFFDTELGKRVAEIEETFVDDPELGAFRLRYLLDPSQPLMLNNREVYNLGELLKLLNKYPDTYEKPVASLLYSGSLEAWLAALDEPNARTLCERIQRIRVHEKDHGVGVMALRHVLEPGRPFSLGGTITITSPDEMEEVFAKNPGLSLKAARQYYNGYFIGWLRACFPQRQDDIAYVGECMERFKEDMELGFFAVRCRFCPSIPFPLGYHQAATPKELAALIQRTPETLDRGIRAMTKGWIRVWLIATGRMRDPAAYDAIVTDFTLSPARKMEAVLHLLDPALPWPSVAVDLEEVNGGTLATGGSKTETICVFNAGRGHLSGSISLTEDDPGFLIDKHEIDGGPVYVRVHMSAEAIPPGWRQHNTILIETNGGKVEIPLTFKVGAPIKSILLKTTAAGLITGETLACVRLLMESLWPQYRYLPLPWLSSAEIAQMGPLNFLPLGLIFLVGVPAALYFVSRAYTIYEE